MRAVLGVSGVLFLLGCAPPGPQDDGAERRAKRFVSDIVPLNVNVGRDARVDAVRPGGESPYALTGAGVLLGQWDEAAVRDTHRELLGRVTIRDGAGLSEHATHVAATMLASGNDASALGTAPEASVYSYSWGLDAVEMSGIGAFVSASSHAYGEALGWHADPACDGVWSWTAAPSERKDGRFGRYGAVAATLDRVVRDADLLAVWAAGNERADGPTTATEPHAHAPSCAAEFTDEHESESVLEYDTLGGAAVAKNVLTVGAVRDLPATSTADSIVPHATSSFGPTDDGRLKPDLVAGGDRVFSASAAADDAYATRSGTSSAAAAVTGIAALLVEQYRAGRAGRDPRASELKAVLVQTARDAGSPGPDYRTGHGLVDARAAAEFLDADRRAARLRVDVATGSPNELVTDDVAEGTALRVTLAWLDPPGPVRETSDEPPPVLENDLDLSLVAPDGSTVFHPWSLDRERPDAGAERTAPNRVDNVEVVDVDAEDNTFSGPWTLRVESPNGLARGVPQAYAIAASVPISAPARPIAGNASRIELEVLPNESTTLSIPITNLGRGSLDWTASTDSSFVTLTRASGSNGDELVMRVAGADFGPRFATIDLESSDPSGPRTIGVRVETPCTPNCGNRECGPDPVCGLPCGRCPSASACAPDGFCDAQGDDCPAADLGSALGSALVSGTTAGTNASFGSCGGELSPDRGFSWSAPRAGRYVFSTEGSAFDTILSLRRGGCNGSEITCNDDALDRSSSLVVELEEGERITAVIDGFDGASGPFALGIHEVSCPDGELEGRLGQNVLADASPGHLDRVQASCTEAPAREATLGFVAPVDGTYRFDASRSNFEASVAVLSDDCAGAELACAPDSADVALTAGQRVIVVVDGAVTSDDRFALAVTTRNPICGGKCDVQPAGALCACDERCLELGDCCVDACGDCANCAAEEACEFGRCIPRRCTSGDCGCGATGGTRGTACDAGAGGVPGEAGGSATEEPIATADGSGCFCTAPPATRGSRLGWLAMALAVALLASRRTRV